MICSNQTFFQKFNFRFCFRQKLDHIMAEIDVESEKVKPAWGGKSPWGVPVAANNEAVSLG